MGPGGQRHKCVLVGTRKHTCTEHSLSPGDLGHGVGRQDRCTILHQHQAAAGSQTGHVVYALSPKTQKAEAGGSQRVLRPALANQGYIVTACQKNKNVPRQGGKQNTGSSYPLSPELSVLVILKAHPGGLSVPHHSVTTRFCYFSANLEASALSGVSDRHHQS